MGYVEGLLAKNEIIVLRARQHWIVLTKALVVNFVLGTLLVALALYVGTQPFVRARGEALVALVLLVVAAIPILSFLYEMMKWLNREYLVTNRRVIQSRGVLSKRVIDSSLEQVNDVVLNQSFLGRLLGYGNIEILTASEIGVNVLRAIAEPIQFKMAMMEQKERMRSGRRYDDPASLLDELEELHRGGVLNDQEYRDKKKQLLERR